MAEPSRTAMTKADLIGVVAKRLDITQVQAGIIVEAALRSIVAALQSGQEVEIRGFGSFRFRNRAPRKGRNPKTGEKVDVPAEEDPVLQDGQGVEGAAQLRGQFRRGAGPYRRRASRRGEPPPPMAAPDEKRQSQRIQPFVAPCRYVLGEERHSGFLTDISERGGRVHTEVEPPSAGTVLTVEVRLGRPATHVRLPATVRWARESPRGGFVFGTSFDGHRPRRAASRRSGSWTSSAAGRPRSREWALVTDGRDSARASDAGPLAG